VQPQYVSLRGAYRAERGEHRVAGCLEERDDAVAEVDAGHRRPVSLCNREAESALECLGPVAVVDVAELFGQPGRVDDVQEQERGRLRDRVPARRARRAVVQTEPPGQRSRFGQRRAQRELFEHRQRTAQHRDRDPAVVMDLEPGETEPGERGLAAGARIVGDLYRLGISPTRGLDVADECVTIARDPGQQDCEAVRDDHSPVDRRLDQLQRRSRDFGNAELTGNIDDERSQVLRAEHRFGGEPRQEIDDFATGPARAYVDDRAHQRDVDRAGEIVGVGFPRGDEIGRAFDVTAVQMGEREGGQEQRRGPAVSRQGL
jgi:hypothetical protein